MSVADLVRLAYVPAALAMVLALPATPARPNDEFGNYTTPGRFTERSSQSTYVTMRDGVRLAVRIDRPARDGIAVDDPLPVIWQNTLSIEDGKGIVDPPSDAGLQSVPSLTRWGYVVAEVARRGNGQSFGSRRGYNDRTESDDAYEMTEWLARQPWSNGRVGIYGCSNTGDAAMHAMEARPPHLKAVFAGCFSWSKYDAMRRGGIFAQWGTGPQRTIEQDMAITPVDGDGDKALLHQAAIEHQQSTNLYELWKSLPYRDSWSPAVASRFWVEGSAGSFADQLRQQSLPLYIMGGWHDELRDQGIIALLNIPTSRLIVGPWKHCMNDGFPLLQEIHRFFDTYLLQLSTHLQDEPRIHYFTMAGQSGGQWHTTDAWPVPEARPMSLYFAAKPGLSGGKPVRMSQRAFRVSAQVACPNAGFGPFMQPCHVPGEGVSYTTAPLRTPLEVTGNPVVHVRVAADRTDVNLFAYLEDVSADGSIYVVTEGRLKASLRAKSEPPFKVPGTPWHRSFQEDANPLQPGRSVAADFDLLPTSYAFAAGHSVQVTITGADFRERDPDSNLRGEQVTVLSEKSAPSYVVLPADSRP